MRKRYPGIKALCAIVVLLAAVSLAPSTKAIVSTFTLTNGNSTATINPATSAGLFDWNVNGVFHAVTTNSFFYRVGTSGAENNVSGLTLVSLPSNGLSDTDFDGLNDTLLVRYTNSVSKFVVNITFALTGGTPGAKSSDIQETIQIKNTGATSLDFHFFDYMNLSLFASSFNNLNFSSPGTVNQTNTLNGAHFSAIATAAGDHQQGALANALFPSLTDASTTTLGGTNAVSGDVAWAQEWDLTIAAGGVSPTINIDNNLVVPEPSALALCVSALSLLGWAIRRTRSVRSSF